MAKLKITLVKSTIGAKENQKANDDAQGLLQFHNRSS